MAKAHRFVREFCFGGVSRTAGGGAPRDMMNMTTLKRALRDAVGRTAGASTLMMALAAAPQRNCSTQESTVLVRDGIGDPCVPSDESNPTFGGYSRAETDIITSPPLCKSGTCLVNHFQGRVTCPSGQTAEQIAAGDGVCTVTNSEGGVEPVTVPVQPQCQNRPAADAVYCTCSCDGDNPSLDYCACPEGFTCQKLLQYVPNLPQVDWGNSFCIRDGTSWGGGLGQTTCE